jgi:peptide deformylase
VRYPTNGETGKSGRGLLGTCIQHEIDHLDGVHSSIASRRWKRGMILR